MNYRFYYPLAELICDINSVQLMSCLVDEMIFADNYKYSILFCMVSNKLISRLFFKSLFQYNNFADIYFYVLSIN